MKIFEATYCSCTFESAFMTISLHKTAEGAEKAIEKSKEEIRKENELVWAIEEGDDEEEIAFKNKWNTEHPYDWDKAWMIVETELQD